MRDYYLAEGDFLVFDGDFFWQIEEYGLRESASLNEIIGGGTALKFYLNFSSVGFSLSPRSLTGLIYLTTRLTWLACSSSKYRIIFTSSRSPDSSDFLLLTSSYQGRRTKCLTPWRKSSPACHSLMYGALLWLAKLSTLHRVSISFLSISPTWILNESCSKFSPSSKT